jgi:FMN-dependent dehydrogenase
LLGVSTTAAVPLAEIAGTGAPWWFQVYVTAERQRSTPTVASGPGEHIAAALAMGARSVFVGRPILWALAQQARRVSNR